MIGFVGFTTAFVGLIISVYSLHVELMTAKDKNYKPLCHINEHMSCTGAFLSKYGHGFGLVEPIFGKESIFYLPNAIFGIVFYSIVTALSIFRFNIIVTNILCILSALSCCMNFYLAYLLYTMKNMCFVCISLYVVNFVLLYTSCKRRLYLSGKRKEE